MSARDIRNPWHNLPLQVRAMSYVAPVPHHRDCWLLNWEPIQGCVIPLFLSGRDDVQGSFYQAWINAARFDQRIMQGSHIARMSHDIPLLKIRIPRSEIPADPAAVPAFILHRMVLAQSIEPPRTIKGTFDELMQLLRDCADLLEAPIQVSCAKSENEMPFVQANHVGTSAERTIGIIVRHFHPIGSTFQHAETWLEERAPLVLDLIEPQAMSGHDQIEASQRIASFLIAAARDHGWSKAMLGTRFKSLGLKVP